MPRRPLRPLCLAALTVHALAASGCAEVYTPRPSGAVVISGNGMGGYRIHKNGEVVGSEWAIRDAVQGDPRAEAEADTAVNERVGSVATGILGAVAVGVGVGLASDNAWNFNGSTSTGMEAATLGLLCGGLALVLTSGLLQGASHTHTFNAANMYNDDMAGRVVAVPRGAAPIPPGAILPEASGVYVAPGPGYAPQPVEAPLLPQ
jgi:hypothetical protein